MKAKDIAQVIEKVANAEQEFNEAKAKAEALKLVGEFLTQPLPEGVESE